MQPFNGALLHEDQLKTVCLFASGSSLIDDFLEGGLMTGEIVELIGPSCSGKTQFSMMFAVSVVEQNFDAHVIFLDLSNSLQPRRLAEILLKNKESSDKDDIERCLRQIHCGVAFDVFQLISTLEHIILTKRCQTLNVKAIILDGCSLVLMATIGGAHSSGFRHLTKVSHLLKRLALESSVTILLTNNVIGSETRGIRPALGQWWATTANIRILMKPSSGDAKKLEMSVIKSSRMLPGEDLYVEITSAGLKGINEPANSWTSDNGINSSDDSDNQ